MKKKQLIGIIVTGAVIIAVGVTGVLSNVAGNYFMSKTTESKDGFFNEIMSDTNDFDEELPDDDYIGVLNIVGEIGATSSDSLTSSGTYNHDMYMKFIDEMKDSSDNKGILLYVDSPGGAVYESDELYLKLMEYKKETKRPVWAYFASEACSGGYYISMAADKIYANRNTWTGSIGVIVSLVNCKNLYEKLGIKEIDITSGKNKAMGSAGLDLTDEQYEILQSLVDEAYDQFVGIVSTGRKMDEATVRNLADGRIYSAKQALELDLVDKIGSLEEEKTAFTKEIGCDEDIEFYAPENEMGDFWSTIFDNVKSIVPKSDVELATDIVENKGNGVLKYYAK
ncbi:MAG: signal peptide peptidase SppA [Butyribacter sp.]|nr:signal peptide peptidase SppA [bacterium]MDY3854225.1 signal peptide peptidase SppA [Butyribacter sp.]